MNSRFRPSLAAVLLGALVFFLPSCGGSEEPAPDSGSGTSSSTGNAGAAGAGGEASIPAWQQPLRQGDLRNVLLVTVDSLRADHLVCYGSPTAHSPRIDHLAATGVRFNQAISSAPQSLPSHASILTGLYPFAHGARTDLRHRLSDEVWTLAQAFQEAGVSTGAVVSSTVLASGSGLERGFETFDDNLLAGSTFPDRTERRTNAADVARRARAWLDQEREQPFFLWTHFTDPTSPYSPPPGYGKLTGGNRYDAEIAFVDEQVGYLLDVLRQKDVLADTLVIVAGAHGESLGEHGEDLHGVFLYDATTRVPVILSHPKLATGSVIHSVSTVADLAPTIASLLGLGVPEGLHGADLSGVVQGGAGLEDRLVYSEALMPAHQYGWAELRALRSTDVRYVRAPQPEFYVVTQDPAETVNLLDDAGEQVSQLSDDLDQLLAAGEIEVLREDALPSVSGPEASGADPKDGIAALVERQRAIAQGLYANPEAEATLLPLIEAQPQDAELQAALATWYMRGGKFELALPHARIAAERKAHKAWPRIVLASVTQALGMPEAQDHLAMVRTRFPNEPGADLAEADWALQARDFKLAREKYMAALEVEPGNLPGLLGLGRSLRAMGLYDDALEALQRAEAIDPRLHAVQFEIGKVCESLGRWAMAAHHFEQAAASAPRRMEAWRLGGWAMCRINRSDDGLRMLQRAVDLGDQHIGTHTLLGELLYQRSRYADAAEHLKVALSKQDQAVKSWLLLAVCQEQLAQNEEAEQSLARARSLDAQFVASMLPAGGPITQFLTAHPAE